MADPGAADAVGPWEPEGPDGLGCGAGVTACGAGFAVGFGVALGVGLGVARGVGLGVGRGVGRAVGAGVGAETTTRAGLTVVRLTFLTPLPVPLEAEKLYAQEPAGKRREYE
jgi:hypothetical protein